MSVVHLLLASRPWYQGMAERLSHATGQSFHFFSSPDQLASANLEEIRPRYVFVPHWSWILPASIWRKFETVIFHMTDLPFGRGGSPLQNLITRGVSESVLTAFRCTGKIDAGPIYLKLPLSLEGSAQEIFCRASRLSEKMILNIIENEPTPQPQTGEPVFFSRRRPEESEIKNTNSLKEIYDHIRMLDAEGYPHAFINAGSLRLEFTKAELNEASLNARVTIRKIDTGDEANGKV